MYPTNHELKIIREFDLSKRPVRELLDYIEPRWEYGDWGFIRKKHRLELHTGGWSGNEDIIDALRNNFLFWHMYWYSHRRGGHFVFNDQIVSKELRGFV
jgi:hypothetical protein